MFVGGWSLKAIDAIYLGYPFYAIKNKDGKGRRTWILDTLGVFGISNRNLLKF